MKAKSCLAGLAILMAAACMKETAVPVPDSDVLVIRAGFAGEEAGTRSRLDFDETYAKVLWTGGDAFRMYKMSSSAYSQTTFTTEDDGTEVATFTSTKRLGEDDSYTSIYPSQQYAVYRKNDDILLRIPVPPVQTAVPGGLAEGLNLAAAWSSTQEADLQFNNLLSVIRFRLEGDAVSSLQSVIFDAGTTVAGDAALYFQEGELKFGYTSNFGTSVTYERSNTVTLSGTFVEGQDYCIAMVPASLTGGFTLTFSDGEGRMIEKHSSKALTLTRSRIVDFGTIDLGDTWSADDQVIQYVTQTKGRKKNVIAVLADGYTSDQLDLFEERARTAVDFLFTVEPYKSYKEYFTVYICRTVSNESGAGVIDENDKNIIIKPVDNRFGSRWPAESYSTMLADAAKVQAYLKVAIPEIVNGELTYKDVPTALLINDPRYGGICHIYGDGWCYSQIPFQKNGESSRWSFPNYQAVNPMDDSGGSRETTSAERDELGRMVGDWKNTFLHEFGGHTYGRLGDEYWSGSASSTKPGAIAGHSYAVPYALNISGYYGSAPWKADLLDHLDEWTARNPDYARIDLWHGASKSIYHRWRSEKISCMIDNRPYYSTWQRILIVRKIMEKTGETFDMDEFIAKDVTVDPIRPVVPATASAEERTRILRKARSQALLVPEMPMLPPPILEDE